MLFPRHHNLLTSSTQRAYSSPPELKLSCVLKTLSSVLRSSSSVLKSAACLAILLLFAGVLTPLAAQDTATSAPSAGASSCIAAPCNECPAGSAVASVCAPAPPCVQPPIASASDDATVAPRQHQPGQTATEDNDSSPAPSQPSGSQPAALQTDCSPQLAGLRPSGYSPLPAQRNIDISQSGGPSFFTSGSTQYPLGKTGKWGGEQWQPALLQALGFTLGENAYRLATEEKTRKAITRETWGRYYAAISGLHTWSDGGKTWTVYVAHPAQGAVYSDMWTEHDPHGALIPFGFNHPYWASRIKAFWWNSLWELQWKFGPFSEASIGNVGLIPGKLGANTIVSTATIGTGVAIGEDMLDRYGISKWEAHTNNLAARALLRSVLNPDRSFANLWRKKYPWYRDTRPTLRVLDP